MSCFVALYLSDVVHSIKKKWKKRKGNTSRKNNKQAIPRVVDLAPRARAASHTPEVSITSPPVTPRNVVLQGTSSKVDVLERMIPYTFGTQNDSYSQYDDEHLLQDEEMYKTTFCRASSKNVNLRRHYSMMQQQLSPPTSPTSLQ